ncbi:signal recognition particle-docking protein FtsY [Anaerococcus sp. NML200574]|uniref:signal recognition particle-docking protein FtsY n=1 Tax=Anaerococcus sp. NML200574 TaxID=2954486 RepID=UPI00223704F8|nr:signal recognition particle-docking protein FtsY [Anaerococcus sp. NML200574]MCW6678073.1 signal recognition particle-docking protein FtsY [Anaerococcus sp. NML200574]
MFDFLRRKKKKDKIEKKEEIIDEKSELESIEDKSDNEESETIGNNLDNDDFNAYNSYNEYNKFNTEEEIQNQEKKTEDKEKSGRFIDLTKDEKTSESISNSNEDEKVSDSIGDNEPTEKSESIFERLKKGLTKTRDNFTSNLKNLFTRNVKIDDDLYDDLEEILISADIGMTSTVDIVDTLRDEIKKRSIKESEQIYPLLKEIMISKLDENNLDNSITYKEGDLTVILVIGVNGVGKTTTIGKLANNFKKEGKNVMLAAADTFRAAAIEQLGEWAQRANVEMIADKEGADPSAVIFDAIKSARSNDVDVLICDTAGRLHNKKNLMQELDKINRTIDTHAVNAHRENLLVLDAATGQNAVSQLREFKNVTDITGLILTKLDGTAKGGVIFPLQVEVKVPVKYIGVGEGIDHLQKFDSKSFVEAMF